MSKGRVSNSERGARRASRINKTGSGVFRRFLGLSLSGGKADKSSLAVLEYFPEQKRLFLARLFDKIKTEETISADQKIIEHIEQLAESAVSVGIDSPLSLPKCLRCKLKCPGYEHCQESEIKWMRNFEANRPARRPFRMMTPYTQRPVDLCLSAIEEENLEIQHALGANLAPLTARAHFLARRIPFEIFEVSTKVAVWRIGLELKVSKAQMRSYRNSAGGEEARRVILEAFMNRLGLFVYHQDLRTLCENPHAFDSLIVAFVGFLKSEHLLEPRPEGFPRKEAWVCLPRRNWNVF